MNRMKAAVFDFDGTIVVDYKVWLDMYDEFQAENHLTVDYNERNRLLVGSVQSVAMNYLKAFPQLSEKYTHEQLVQRFVDGTRDGTLSSPPVHGAIEYIKNLHERNIPVAIVSSSVSETIHMYLKKYGIDDCVSFIVEGKDVVHCKPNPEGYLTATKHFNVEAKEAVVYEDSVSALLGAKSAEFKTVLVNTSGYKGDMTQYDYVITDFDTLPNLF